jgi:hypothetical protein
VREQLEGDRGNQDRHRELGSQHGRLGRDLRYVHQHPRAQLPGLVGVGIAAQGPLVAGAAREVAVGARPEALRRQALEIGDVDRIGDGDRLVRVRPRG